MEDMTITCEDCEMTFVFSAREQEYFAKGGYVQPKRCKPCRDYRKSEGVRYDREAND
jgi:Probable zinc-ribbon domain